MPAGVAIAMLSSLNARLTREAEAAATAALEDKRFRKLVDERTNASTSKPPPPILALFRDKLSEVAEAFRKRNRGATVIWSETYQMERSKWMASVTARVLVRTRVKGGGQYQIAKGDTLWSIAERTYGAGSYWPEIEAANRGVVRSGGKFILAGVRINLPKVLVPATEAAPEVFARREDRRACSPAMGVALPDMTVSFAPSRVFRKVIPTPTTTLVVTCDVEGDITFSQGGEMPVGFNLTRYEAELKSEVEGLASSITIGSAGMKSIGFSSDWGNLGSMRMKWNDDGSLAGELSAKVGPRKVGAVTATGSVTISLEVRFLPNLKAQRISGKVVAVAYDVAEAVIYVLAGLVVVAAIIVAAKALAVTTVGAGLVAASLAIIAMPLAMKQLAR